MASVRFRLDISAEDVLRYYSGTARDVVARGLDGRTIRFPANRLRPHVRVDGVHGLFELEYDEGGRFKRLARLA